jgi:hypothetical protein
MDIGFRVTSIRVGQIFPNPRKNRRKHGSRVPKLVNTSSSQLDQQESPASQNKANKRKHHPSQQSHQSMSRTTCRNSVPSILHSISQSPSFPPLSDQKERKKEHDSPPSTTSTKPRTHRTCSHEDHCQEYPPPCHGNQPDQSSRLLSGSHCGCIHLTISHMSCQHTRAMGGSLAYKCNSERTTPRLLIRRLGFRTLRPR